MRDDGDHTANVWRQFRNILCCGTTIKDSQYQYKDDRSGQWPYRGHQLAQDRDDHGGKIRIFMTPCAPEVPTLQRTQTFITETRKFLVLGGALQVPRPLITWPVQYSGHIKARYPGVAGRPHKVYRVESAMVYKKPKAEPEGEEETIRQKEQREGKTGFVPPCYCPKCDSKPTRGTCLTKNGIRLEGLRCVSPFCPHSRIGPLMLMNPEQMVFRSKQEHQRAIALAEKDWDNQWRLIPSKIRSDIRAPQTPRAILKYEDAGGFKGMVRAHPSTSMGLSGDAYFEYRDITFAPRRKPVEHPIRRKPVKSSKLGSGAMTPIRSTGEESLGKEGLPELEESPTQQYQGKRSYSHASFPSSPLLISHTRRSSRAYASLELQAWRIRRDARSKVRQSKEKVTALHASKSAQLSGIPPEKAKSPRHETRLGSRSPRPQPPGKCPTLEYSPKPIKFPTRQYSGIRRFKRSVESRACSEKPNSWSSISATLILSNGEDIEGLRRILACKDFSQTSLVPAPLNIGRAPSPKPQDQLKELPTAPLPRHPRAKDKIPTFRALPPSGPFFAHYSIATSTISTAAGPPTPRGPYRDILSREITPRPTPPPPPQRRSSTSSSLYSESPPSFNQRVLAQLARVPSLPGQELLPPALRVGRPMGTDRKRRRRRRRQTEDPVMLRAMAERRQREMAGPVGDGDVKSRFADEETLRILEGGPGTWLREGESGPRAHQIEADREKEMWM